MCNTRLRRLGIDPALRRFLDRLMRCQAGRDLSDCSAVQGWRQEGPAYRSHMPALPVHGLAKSHLLVPPSFLPRAFGLVRSSGSLIACCAAGSAQKRGLQRWGAPCSVVQAGSSPLAASLGGSDHRSHTSSFRSLAEGAAEGLRQAHRHEQFLPDSRTSVSGARHTDSRTEWRCEASRITPPDTAESSSRGDSTALPGASSQVCRANPNRTEGCIPCMETVTEFVFVHGHHLTQ